MKIENVYIKPDGHICACTVPVPPEPNRDRRHGQTTEFHFKIEYNKYRDVLQACKDSSVRFEDQFSATILLHASLKIEPPRKAVNEELKEHVKNDTFYPLQCEVEIGPCNKFNSCPIDSGCENCKVARLIPEAPVTLLTEKEFNSPENQNRDNAIVGYRAAPIVEESQLIIVTRKLQKNLEDYKRMRDGWKEGTHQYEAYALMVREYRKIIDMLLPIAITRKP